jgi:predicted DNA-binding protein (UPF0251 family)/predicted Fe-Mo cluster-binding NifX family protein
MARTKNNRVVLQPPRIKGFNPIGNYSKERNITTLFLEEYESIRLLDYDMLSQVEAAKYMQVSRPTLTRIYQSARQKVAAAMVEGNTITIEGGSAVFSDEWQLCPNCSVRFSVKNTNTCALCDHSVNQLVAIPVDQPAESASLFTAFARAPFFMLTDHQNRTVFIENSLLGQPKVGVKVVDMLHKLGMTAIAAYELGIPVMDRAQQHGMNLMLLPAKYRTAKDILKLIKKDM